MPTKTEMEPGSRWVRAGLAAGLAAVFAIVIALPPLLKAPSLAWPCGFHFLTGLPCLFCGGTRAFFAAAKGQFAEAWHFSPLGLLAWPGAWLLLAWCLFRCVRPRRRAPSRGEVGRAGPPDPPESRRVLPD